MTPSHSGEFIPLEMIEAIGFTVAQGVRALSVRRWTLSKMVHTSSSGWPESACGCKSIRRSMNLPLRMLAWHHAPSMRAR